MADSEEFPCITAGVRRPGGDAAESKCRICIKLLSARLFPYPDRWDAGFERERYWFLNESLKRDTP